MFKRHVPAGMHPPFSNYSHGVEVPSGARWLTVAGQLGVTEAGEIPEDAGAQAKLSFENIGRVLAAAGMDFADIVHLNTYVTDRAHVEGYRAARASFMTDPPPSSTLLIVAGLARPEFKIEIEAIAARDPAATGQSCNLCGSTSNEVISRLSRYLLPLRTVMCTRCALVFTSPIPDVGRVERFYERYYRFLYQGVVGSGPGRGHVRRRRREAEILFDLLERYLPAERDAILEIGSGSGEFLALCRERGYAAVGIEPGRKYAEYTRNRLGLDVHTTTLAGYSGASSSVKLAVMKEVVEHLADPSATLAEVNRLLVPGGILYVRVPNLLNAELPPISRFHFAHIFNFTPRTLDMMLAKAGFRRSGSAPRSDQTLGVFEKVGPPVRAVEIDEEAVPEVQAFLARHSAMKYLFSWSTYARFFETQFRLLRDRLDR